VIIPHAKALIEGRFLARYDRFIAAVSVDSRVVEAHCVNPGRMEGLIRPGARAWISGVPKESARKLRYTLELLEIDGIVIGVNTIIANRLAEAVVTAKLIPGLKRYRSLSREVAYGERSRIDLLLEGAHQRHWVEVKNCHLVYPDGGAYFPDSVSKRATEHLDALVQQVQAGDKASVLFIVQRRDGTAVRPSALHDPVFANRVVSAAQAGVRFLAAQFAPSARGFEFLRVLPVDIKPRNIQNLTEFRDALKSTSGWVRRGKAKH
jgi:sugar fermentation stimulation protein A